MAALGFENPSNDCVYVVAEVNNTQHVLCSLQSGKIPQQVLNLSFTEGEHVSFYIEGEGQVHLTGFLTPEDDSDFSDDSSDEIENGGSITASGTQSNHVPVETGTNEVSDISWQGILSGSQEKDSSNNNNSHEGNMGNIPVTNGLRDAQSDVYVNDNSNDYVKNISSIPNVQGLNSTTSDYTNDEKNAHSDDLDTRSSLLGKAKKKEGDADNSVEDDVLSDDSDSRYMLAEEKKTAAKRKGSSSSKLLSESATTSTPIGKKPRGKSQNPKTSVNAVQNKSKTETKKKNDTSTKKKVQSKPETKKKGQSKSKKASSAGKPK